MPKPSDWGPLVDVVGYCFLNLGSKYLPPEKFVQWIKKGASPIYIGFGSMPLEDSKKTTDIILEALKNTGQRGIIDRGWGDLGTCSSWRRWNHSYRAKSRVSNNCSAIFWRSVFLG